MQILTEEIDYRLWYDVPSELEKAENDDEYPPRFKLKLNCHNPLDPKVLDYCYSICVKRLEKVNRYLSFNVFISSNNSKGLKFYSLPKCTGDI